MNWKQSLAKGEVKPHQTSKQELDNIRKLIACDLADANLYGYHWASTFSRRQEEGFARSTMPAECLASQPQKL